MAPGSRGLEMIGIISALVGVATIAVILRIIARLKRRLHFGVDDYLCFTALVLLYGMFVELILWCTIGGNGAHDADITPQTRRNFYRIFLSNQFLYFVLCPVVKISIVCFYRRVFSIPRFQQFSFGLNCLMGTWSAGIFFACAGQCRPLRAYWDHSVFNVVMDFVILGMPIPIIWRLQKAWHEKLELTAVFAVGGFVCFASIYRIVVLFYIDPADTTYTVYKATLWTHIEPSVGLTCSCLPTIRGLLPRFIRGLLPRFIRGRSTNRSKTWTTGQRYASNNGHLSSSNTSSSAPFMTIPRGDAEFLVMSDVAAYGGKGLDDRSVEGGVMDITIKTDINVYRGSRPSSMRMVE
ncbi:hypothetical protein MPDQ_003243 [Monascus purpureus]|uniref:Rhodopsin domain-containing protein n=1 Tax=Monascus purpureus TaxID=5098 RepID=A0A507QJ49_MONPU|nr:hypothetical protein MPDQ_003243 [Monascus purpureus]BDD56021.1 hypothetical protein MAP00_001504 [Monascus purpureus]